jgi:hypothetical protein
MLNLGVILWILLRMFFRKRLWEISVRQDEKKKLTQKPKLRKQGALRGSGKVKRALSSVGRAAHF